MARLYNTNILRGGYYPTANVPHTPGKEERAYML